MTAGIEYSPMGTIDVTFDDKTYHLGLPKMRQFRYFTRKLEDVATSAQDELKAQVRATAEAWAAVLEATPSVLVGTFQIAEAAINEDNTTTNQQVYERTRLDVLEAAPAHLREAHEEASEALTEISKTPLWTRTWKVTAEMFAQIGDPLPDDVDDWPVWLAGDTTIPGTILTHWRTAPKASGAQSTG